MASDHLRGSSGAVKVGDGSPIPIRSWDPSRYYTPGEILALAQRNAVVGECLEYWKMGWMPWAQALAAAVRHLADQNERLLRDAQATLTAAPGEVLVAKVGHKASGVGGRVQRVGEDGRCLCNCADSCPLGRTGTSLRCSQEELLSAGVRVFQEKRFDVASLTLDEDPTPPPPDNAFTRYAAKLDSLTPGPGKE